MRCVCVCVFVCVCVRVYVFVCVSRVWSVQISDCDAPAFSHSSHATWEQVKNCRLGSLSPPLQKGINDKISSPSW